MGKITKAEYVENYPGFPQGISGIELGQSIHQQCIKYGMETLFAEAVSIKHEPKHNIVSTTESDIVAKCVIIVSGLQFRKLGVLGEDKFTGKGVSYCATCDGPLFRDKQVVVVGGGDTALSEALYLSKFASSVTIIHRRSQLRAIKILEEKARAEAKIKFILDTIVAEIEGDELVKNIRLKNVKDATISVLSVAGIFIAVGLTMWVEVARVVRGQVLSVREKEYVEAARALGFGNARIIFRHILPNVMSPVIIISAANFATAILLEAGLSFLGIGVQPPVPSWGTMIKEHYGYIIMDKAYLAILPGIAIMLMVLSFTLVGNGLRDALDTKS